MHLPLNALRAFEAAARHQNLTRAAEELHVTQTAVSQHIRKLEDRLGKPLFRRLPRGLALTLRAPVPWLATQASPATGAAAAQASANASAAGGALQVPFAGGGQPLQSGVMALVLQGMDAAAPRTSALLVLDLQPQLAATVYGRDMLQQATGRLDPWTQMAVLQASGQVPREEDRARNGASGLCETVGCPYAARAACVQPFCLAMRGVLPPEPVGPASSA